MGDGFDEITIEEVIRRGIKRLDENDSALENLAVDNYELIHSFSKQLAFDYYNLIDNLNTGVKQKRTAFRETHPPLYAEANSFKNYLQNITSSKQVKEMIKKHKEIGIEIFTSYFINQTAFKVYTTGDPTNAEERMNKYMEIMIDENHLNLILAANKTNTNTTTEVIEIIDFLATRNMYNQNLQLKPETLQFMHDNIISSKNPEKTIKNYREVLAIHNAAEYIINHHMD